MPLQSIDFLKKEADSAGALGKILFRQHPVQMLILDEQDIIAELNKAAAELFRVKADELCGKNIFEIIPGYGNAEKICTYKKSGCFIEFQYTSQPFFAGDSKYSLVTITELRKQVPSYHSLSFRAELETLLKNIAANFINAESDKIDENINNALSQIGKLADADRCFLFTYNKKDQTMSNTYEWCVPGISSRVDILKGIPADLLPWWNEQITRNKQIYIPDVALLPVEVVKEKEVLEAQDIKSLVAVPVFYEEEVFGFLGFAYAQHCKDWDEDSLEILKFTGAIIASALMRKAKDEHNERTDFLFKLVVEKIRDGIIVEDENNNILLANRELCRLFGIKSLPENIIGKKWNSIIDEIKDVFPDQDKFVSRIKELTEKKKLCEGEVIKLNSGKIVERDYIPLYAKGKFLGHFRKYIDITPIKINEEKALGNQSRLNNILHSLNTTAYSRILESSDLVYENNSQGNVNGLSVNSFYTGPALMSDLIYEDDKLKVMDFLSEILKTGYGEIEYRTVSPDGQIRWIYDRCKLIKNSEHLPVSLDGVATDITDRKLMQLALEESEQRYRHVVNSIKEVLFQTDSDGRWTLLNPAWEELTGYKIEEALGQHFWEFVHSEDKALAYALFRMQKKTKQQVGRSEVRYLTKDGKIGWLEVFVQLIMGADDKISGTFGTLVDVSERKTVQKQLELRDKAISAVQSGVVITDPNRPDNPIIFCNPGFEKNTGFSQEEVLGRNCRFLQGPGTDRNTVKEIREAVASASHCNVILKNYRKDGTTFWNNLTISPIKDERGKLINFVGIQSDITGRIKTEEALQESENKFRSVVENVKEVVFQTDVNGDWTYLNKSWEEITGYSVEESLGTPFLNYVHPDDRAKNQELFEPLIQRKKEYCRHTVRYLKKDGGFRYIEVYARLTFDKDDNILGTSGTLYDVTNRLQAEEDIRLALEKQKELNELKSRFISTVSHEFRTPLTSILASADLLQRYVDKWDNEKKIKTLVRIQDSVEHMNSMITDVLTLNKAESGAVVFNPKTADLVKICRTIFDEVKIAGKPVHKFVFETTSEEITGSFDEKLLRQLVQNLLSNAVKYSPNGGEIKLRIEFNNQQVTIVVSDQGVGISPEDQGKLFQPFFRGANIGNIPGTGLGLSILQKAVELQDGNLSFTSNLNQGTTFRVSIPYRS
jgi:PAS domain S-box-containing protein